MGYYGAQARETEGGGISLYFDLYAEEGLGCDLWEKALGVRPPLNWDTIQQATNKYH